MIQEATVLSVLTSGRVYVRLPRRPDPVLTNSPAVRVEPGDRVLVGEIAGGRGNLAVIGLRSPVVGELSLAAGWAFEEGSLVAVSRTGETIRSHGTLVPSGTPGAPLASLPWGPPYPAAVALVADLSTGPVVLPGVVSPLGVVSLSTTPPAGLVRVYLDLVVPA